MGDGQPIATGQSEVLAEILKLLKMDEDTMNQLSYYATKIFGITITAFL